MFWWGGGPEGRPVEDLWVLEIECEAVDWINLTQDRQNWRNVVETVMKIWWSIQFGKNVH